MLLEKNENLPELSAKQLVIQSGLARSDYVWCVKNQNINVFCSKVRYFSYLVRVIQVQV